MLVGGTVGDRVTRLQRTRSAMLLGVETGFMFGLMFGVWLMKRFALFEVGSAQLSVQHRACAYGRWGLTATHPNPIPPPPIPSKHHSPPCIPCSMS